MEIRVTNYQTLVRSEWNYSKIMRMWTPMPMRIQQEWLA